MKVWQTGDVIHAVDVNRWEESAAVFTTILNENTISIDGIGYDELKALIVAGRMPRVVIAFEGGNTTVEMLYMVEIEKDVGGIPTGEFLTTTPSGIGFERQEDGSAMATMG